MNEVNDNDAQPLLNDNSDTELSYDSEESSSDEDTSDEDYSYKSQASSVNKPIIVEDVSEDEDDDDEPSTRRSQRRRTHNVTISEQDYVFLHTTFEELDDDMHFQFMQQAIKDVKESRNTTLLGKYVTGLVFNQMRAQANLKKHGERAWKALMKELRQLKALDIVLGSTRIIVDSTTEKRCTYTKEPSREEHAVMAGANMVNIPKRKPHHPPSPPIPSCLTS